MSNSIVLNGTTQYGLVPNFPAIDALSGDMCLEGWFWNDPTSSAFAYAVNFGNGTGDWAGFQTENGVGNEGINFHINYSGTNADGFKSSGVFNVSTWRYVAMVGQLNGVTKIYKGDVSTLPTELASYNLQNTPTGTVDSAVGMSLALGQDYSSGTDPFWKGKIGGFVRAWNTGRTLTQLQNNYKTQLLTYLNTGLVINLNFSEGTGTTIANESNISYPASLTGSPTWDVGPDITLLPRQTGSMLTMFQ